jgi:two-component system phosphate regulon sensor histidine kinase PhoR
MKSGSHSHVVRPLLEHSRLISLINSMADGVIALDKHQKIAMYNGAALNVLDLNKTIDGLPIKDILNPLDKNNQPIDITEYIENIKTQTTNRDLKLEYEDGSVINLYLNVAPVNSGYGREAHGGYVLQLRDITREKSLEEERDEFISVVSHELRTPIAIAEGNISNAQFIVTKSTDITQVKQTLEDAHKQILFLSDMINDLATLSRAERGKLNVDIEAINAHDLILELASAYGDQAKSKGLEIKTDLDPKLELLQSSKLYVREILQNFITNALKYTEKGSITLGAKPDSHGVIFTVSDTGIGISKSDQEKIFDKFFRSEDYRTRSTNGTGLGLYVTMKLTRLLHAEISVDSQLNHGSTFTIVIPNLQ